MDISQGSFSDPGPKVSIWYFSDEGSYKVEEPSVSSTEPEDESSDKIDTDKLSGFTKRKTGGG